ncbi:DUF192 domain-containing protein (plasmid) [Acuticoccus sp. MNP-M23]|uniref:DUF192 domain-containing protein n=1 Tax=Acuticoccus sp. MNP-M23 TaxID=3072793 RepID=UPI002816286B|nr:DUF192 domain-containing protein [Acuticoccus sp. MNP-M23]WMS45176.1 DUF192 domain-containing protein [Acuticoccus sp. MNP-M23]
MTGARSTIAKTTAAIGAAAALAFALAAFTRGPEPEAAPLDVATVATSAGPITVEIASDPATRARGLMYRQTMPRDHGMWFVYPSEAPRAFWMKNTPLPLDIVFVAGDGRVVSIAHDATPFSTDPIPSAAPARFVLEVNAGVADEIGLAPGDRLTLQD